MKIIDMYLKCFIPCGNYDGYFKAGDKFVYHFKKDIICERKNNGASIWNIKEGYGLLVYKNTSIKVYSLISSEIEQLPVTFI